MMKHKKSTLAAAGIGAASVALVASSAFAYPLYTVEVGGSSSPGTHAFTAVSGAVSFSVKHWTGSGWSYVSMGCTSATVGGNVRTGGPHTINPFLEITSFSASGCTAPGGAATMTMASAPWYVYGTSLATTPITDIVDTETQSFSAHLASVIPGVCGFDMGGFITGTFDENPVGTAPNQTQTLTLSETGYTGNLSVTSAGAGACLGTIGTGEAMDLSATFAVTVGDGLINLS